MKFLIFFVLCFVALAAADPQLLVPGVVAPLAPRTVVAGPTVVNGYGGFGFGRFYAPGVVGFV